jgi:hypothetical protein
MAAWSGHFRDRAAASQPRRMQHPLVSTLIARLKQAYGQSFVPYGTSDEESEGTGFRIIGIEATFSVMCTEDVPTDMLDIQIESYPPGDYIFTDVVTLEGLMALIENYRGPMETWP